MLSSDRSIPFHQLVAKTIKIFAFRYGCFRPDLGVRKTLFLWEGVTLYLREADVRKTIQEVRRHSPAGSVFIADLYSETFVKKLGGSGGAKKLLEYTNEGLAFGLPMAADYEKNLSDFIESESMSVGDTCFMGENSSKGPYMVIVEVKQESAIS